MQPAPSKLCSLALSCKPRGLCPGKTPQAGSGQAVVASPPILLSSQAGCENPSISLHVIGLNGPTHDLEMTPPDDPRMRFAPLSYVRKYNDEVNGC